MASRTTSAWRARPWQAWTWTERSVGVEQRPGVAAGGASSSRMAAWRRCSSVGGLGGGRGWWTSRDRDRRRPASAEHHLHLVAVAAPGPQQRVVQRRRSRRRRPSVRRRRVQREDVHVAVGGQRPQHVEVAGREAGQAEQATAGRAGRRAPGRRRGRRSPSAARSAGLGCADRGAEPPPQLGLPARVVGEGRAVAVDVVAGGPGQDHRRAGARRSGRTGRRGGGRRRSGGRASRRRRRRRRGGRRARRSHGSPRLASTTSSSGHASRSGRHGSVVGVDPGDGGQRRPGRAARGTGTARLAQTPSARPGEVPRRAAGGGDSHRSTPRECTATTSGVNGSAGGSARSSARASASTSARSARCSTNVTATPPQL